MKSKICRDTMTILRVRDALMWIQILQENYLLAMDKNHQDMQ